MARVVKEYAVRRTEILDAAQRLVYTKGYEQMTVQDILDELQIAKGTFFHYFGSKQALLEALIDRMIAETDPLLSPIVQDPHLSALEKLRDFFATANRWKVEQKDFFLSLLRVWYADENAIFRQKAVVAGLKQVEPMLTAIIRQGIHEGMFSVSYPDNVGEVVSSLMQGLGENYAQTFLSFEPGRGDLRCLEQIVAAYTDALERVLGAPTGSVTLVDEETMREWMTVPRDSETQGHRDGEMGAGDGH
jgi:TetR/AcrR family transcriptional regulator, transcriptional repressor for nem operon